MEKYRHTPLRKRTTSHLKSLALYLKQQPKPLDFKLSDWLRTLELEDLDRIGRDANSIFESFTGCTPITKRAKDVAKAACLAYGAENPTIEAELITERLVLLAYGMSNAAFIEIVSRCGWVVMTERMGVWPRAERPYQVSRRGRIEGEQLTSPRTRALLGLAARPSTPKACP
jgi:hypothetical protein